MSGQNDNSVQYVDDGEVIRKNISHFMHVLRASYRLFICLSVISIALTTVYYSTSRPMYSAMAVIGPPNPSPTNSLLSSSGGLSGGSVSSGAVSRILGGGSGAFSKGNDIYQEYLQLLYSKRLADELVKKDDLLPVVFSKQWDANKKRWKEKGVLHNIATAVKRTLHQPTSDHPDADTLKNFIEKKLSVTQTKSFYSSILANSNYMSISLELDDREQAVKLLSIILHRADEIIRQEQMRNVDARIAYINSQLSVVTQEATRNTLIAILSGQEQLKVMLIADSNFSILEVQTPAADPNPVKPMPFRKAVMMSVLFATFIWFLLALLQTRLPFAARVLRIFSVRSAKDTGEAAL